jgi:hypothetical protein
MVLSAGLGGTSLFALGYLIFSLLILWEGNNLYTMKNYPNTLMRWKMLIIYNVFAMFSKIILQVNPNFLCWNVHNYAFSGVGMRIHYVITRPLSTSATFQHYLRKRLVTS